MKTNSSNIEPLAWRLLPENVEEFYGQEHLLGPGAPLRSMVEKGEVYSCLFWGPPGVGKTAFARFLAKKLKYRIFFLNAIETDAKQIREIFRIAEFEGQGKTILVVDEIEKFNKSQQNIFLSAIEKGLVYFIGISFENPYYRLNRALVSRLKIFEFKPLSEEALLKILEKAISSKKGLDGKVKFTKRAKLVLVRASQSDARKLLNFLEMIPVKDKKKIDEKDLEKIITDKKVYDTEMHYDMVSAFIKSMRGSDVDSALFWLAQMLERREDPLFIARRILIFASEDIGNADPQALILASAATKAVEIVGMPEARIIHSQAVIYCASTYKSNACYMAISKAQEAVQQEDARIPQHLTKKGARFYRYPHAFGGWVDQIYSFLKRKLYFSKGIGFEKELSRRLQIVKRSYKKEDS